MGRYADPVMDLEGMAPADRQGVLDEFAADLEARRQPRHRFSHGEDVPVPAPSGPPPGFSATDGEWVLVD